MERSPMTMGEWQEKGKRKIALEKLKRIRLSHALYCAMSCTCGLPLGKRDKRNGKIALAASKGILNLLIKSQGGR